MNNQERENDYVKHWGNAQKCESCGYVMPYGPYERLQSCCGKKMKTVKEVSHTDD